jgi:pimeloyl-ACP methyl ester carboxylesterase
MTRVFVIALALVAIAAVALGAAIIFGAAPAPPPLASLDASDRKIGEGLADNPPLERYAARDGARLAFRRYPGAPGGGLVVLVHGSSGNARAVHRAAKALAAAGMTVIAPDIRGHGDSGAHGDIAYLGQLDDDMADLARALDKQVPNERRILAGHSSGGGFILHIAGGKYACAFDGYLALSPYLNYRAATVRPNSGGWARSFTPRIVALSILNGLGVHAFDGLATVAFALPPGPNPERTGAYSFRLMRNFGLDIRGWEDEVRRIRRPTRVLVGDHDELFVASAFTPTLGALNRNIAVAVLAGPNHMGMVLDDAALAALVANARAMLTAPAKAQRCTP